MRNRLDLYGTLEDFPEWKTFEVGMVDGCDLGNLLVDGELAPYFYDVMQPVYFVSDSSADTGTVKLQVALVEEIIGLRPIQNNTDKQIKTENSKLKKELRELIITRRQTRTKEIKAGKNNYEYITPGNPENEVCPVENFSAPVPSNFSLNIVGDECDFENCDWDYEDVSVVLERQVSNYEQQPNSFEQVCLIMNDPNNPNETHLAQSRPLDYYRQRKNLSGIWENSWEVVPCLDNEGNVRFKILTHDLTQPANIYVDFISDICYNFINPNPEDDNLLTSHEQLAGISDPVRVMRNLCGHYEYPQRLSEGAKIIESVLERHEEIHREAYQAIVDRRIINFLIPKLNEQIYACEVYKMVFTKSEDIKREIFSAIRQFVLECKDDYARESFIGDYYDETEHYNYEENIQCDESITTIIEEYITWLNRYQNITIPTFCNTCLN